MDFSGSRFINFQGPGLWIFLAQAYGFSGSRFMDFQGPCLLIYRTLVFVFPGPEDYGLPASGFEFRGFLITGAQTFGFSGPIMMDFQASN